MNDLTSFGRSQTFKSTLKITNEKVIDLHINS